MENQEDPDAQVLTVGEAARLLRLNPKSIYKLVDEGKLPHVRLSQRRIRFLRSSLLSWLAGQERAPRSRIR